MALLRVYILLKILAVSLIETLQTWKDGIILL